MNSSGRKYKDRFGNVWSAQVESNRGKLARVSFTCGELRLVAVEGETTDRAEINAARLRNSSVTRSGW